MDPLSDVLSLLKPRSYVSAGFDAGGDWSVRFSQQQNFIKCCTVVSGQCWLAVDGVPEPMHLTAGDCFVLGSGRTFRLASDLSLPAVESVAVFSSAQEGGVVTYNGGGGFFLGGSRFAVNGDHVGILLAMLPPVVHLWKESDRAALRWAVERMAQELRERQPGNDLVVQQLAHMMLVQALRLYLSDEHGEQAGWLGALADKQIGAAINAIHQDPAQRWTLAGLAGVAGMSRSIFAQKFKQKVGTPPMEYLTRWRMLLAADRLANSSAPIARVALSLGYESESAFGAAFKRVMGGSPRQYSLERQAASLG
ncbi:AraC family transcriptional regulator [Rugamonas aquatica]|uniref:Helix-turn-helix domain-containing protein n=1 Tax=Rugamonas aquatica TaxID=2743357 RepID=A0A6A7MZU6_9BURK|nr:AraC family transcriptional regulator [Rugamonas aquatica]MQA38304.1 helix-turn-helix domain-containing protein [Rugamonas aquatica]